MSSQIKQPRNRRANAARALKKPVRTRG